MVLNSSLLLIMRSIGAALLMLSDMKIFVAYMAGDQLLYLLQKLARRDFLYWIPVEGAPGVALSLLVRVMVKTLTDFTGIVQFRAAGELGGVMWLWSMFMALVAPWAAVPVYFERNEGRILDRSGAYRLLAILTASWIILFAVFIKLMRKRYRSTFWSTETGNEWVQTYFLHGASEDVKKNVLTKNKAKWKPIEPQVKEWVREGWLRWEREKPDWFTDQWKAKVPVDWVPMEGQVEHSEARKRERSIKDGGAKRVFAAD
jgi:hypothetical protein